MIKRILVSFVLLVVLLLTACGSSFASLLARETAVAPSAASTAGPSATPTPDPDLLVYQPALKPAFAADVFLLPDATRYDIQVSLLPGARPRLSGVEQVRYTNAETGPLEQVVFRLYPNLPDFGGSMAVTAVAVNGTPVQPTYTAGQSALHVPLRPALAPGQSVTLTLEYAANVPTDTRSGYAVFAYADNVYALAGFYPTIPVYDAEGWNIEVAPPYGDVTYTDAAFYRVRLTAPADLVAVTSGQVVETTDNGDATHTVTAVGGLMRDFYLALSADYRSVTEDVAGTRVSAYYRPGQEAGGQLALKFATAALRVFDAKFGAYPYTELDVIPTPTTAGGIEYPGAVVVSQGLLAETGRYFELVVAHEVAHQWWYGLVGTDQLDTPWLDESLTNYSMYVYFQATAAPEEAENIMSFAFEDAYQELQQNNQDRGIGGPVAGFKSQSDYVAVVYSKGPLFFAAVRERLGDNAFFAALQSYLAQHRYGVAYAQDLISAFEAASGQSIDDLYRAWILGQQP